MNRLLAERLVTHASAPLDGLTAQQLFDGAAGQPDGDLVRLLTKARDITAQMPQSACVVALHHHVFRRWRWRNI